MKKKILHLLTAGLSPADMTTLRTLMMTNGFLFISIITFSLFSYLNFYIFNASLIGVLDASAAVFSFIALIDLQKNHALNRAIIIGVFNFFLFFLTFAYTNQNKDFGLIWTIFFPIFVITLMGHKKGLWITLIFYAVLFSMAFTQIGVWEEGAWNLRSFLRFSIASMVLTYVVYIYERVLFSSNKELALTREKEAAHLKELHRLSSTDPLTGLHNRRRMDEELEVQLNNFNRHGVPFSLIMFDIDDFKMINDQFGHNVGDQVLIRIADITMRSLRKADHVGRWGGEEFLILLSNTSLQQAAAVAEKIRKEVEEYVYPHGSKVTCSFGITECTKAIEKDAIVDYADNALYTAKKSGKNCVCTTTYEDEPPVA